MTTEFTMNISANQADSAFLVSNRFWIVKWIGAFDKYICKYGMPKSEYDKPIKFRIYLRSPECEEKKVINMFKEYIKSIS